MLILVICDAGRTIFLPVFFFARRRKGPLIRPPSTTVDAIDVVSMHSVRTRQWRSQQSMPCCLLMPSETQSYR